LPFFGGVRNGKETLARDEMPLERETIDGKLDVSLGKNDGPKEGR